MLVVREEHALKILLIPATDWLRHPATSRQHHIFELLTERHDIHVIQFNLYPTNPSRSTPVTVHPVPTLPSTGLAQYYLLNMGFYWRTILQVIYTEQIDVLVVSNLLPGIPTAIRKPPCKVVVDLKDLFSDNSSIYYNKNSIASTFIQRTAENVLHLLLTHADHVIAVSQYLVNYAQRLGVRHVSLIPNGADLRLFSPTITRDLNPSLRRTVKDCPVIGFVGTIDRWIDFDTVLDALEQLITSLPTVKLLIVGGKMVTNYLDEVKASVRQRQLSEHVIFTGLVPHDHVPYYVNLMDVCLIPMHTELRLNQARCPDKLFEYLACGKPVVSTKLSEVIRIGGNTITYYDDAMSLTRQVQALFSNPPLRERLRREALEIAQDHDWATITAQFEQVLERIHTR